MPETTQNQAPDTQAAENPAQTQPQAQQRPEKPQKAPKPQKARPSSKKPKPRPTKPANDGNVARGMKNLIPKSKKTSNGKPSIFDAAVKGDENSKGLFGGLTPRMILELAAPHTWAASIMPVFLAMCLATADEGQLSSLMLVVLLLISVLMQSAVNTFNDYKDFVAGTDTRENQDDPTDAVLVYNNVEPYGARNLAVAFLVAAFVLGIYVIVNAGLLLLVIAIIGAVCVYLYSGGPKPLSYTPAGEIVSGVVMGGLITFACYIALTGTVSFLVIILSLPCIIGIGLIMMTNNTCDIEKDRKASRNTLAVVLGRKDAVSVYHILVFAWVILIALLVVIFYPTGSLGLLFLLSAIPPLTELFRNPLKAESRQAAMSAITSANVCLGLVYGAAILLSGVVMVVA
jgi:1,4-dihydroxy-2-naphthoate polyprenyltransferase